MQVLIIEYSTSTVSTQKRDNFAAAGAGYILMFAGGDLGGSNYSDFVDTYDIATGQLLPNRLSESRTFLSGGAVGTKIMFAGGIGANGYSDKIDIYDIVTQTWSTAKLSKARAKIAVASFGEWIIFAGGETATTKTDSTVDMYTTSTNRWTTTKLSLGRKGLTGAAASGKILFAGGTNTLNANADKMVDIFDTDLGRFVAPILMPNSHTGFSGAGTGNQIAFSGGNGTAIMDVYNTDFGTWSSVNLTDQTTGAAAAAGTKIAFSINGRKLKVYDIKTGTVTNLTNSSDVNYTAAAATKNKIIFAGGLSQTLDYYTLSK